MDGIAVFPKPNAGITTQSVCDSAEAIFLDNSDSTYVSIISWNWEFNDPDPLITNDNSNIENPNPYIYSDWGNFNISLEITDQNGCKDIADTTINIWPNPVADFDTLFDCLIVGEPLCSDDTVTFNSTSTLDPFGGILSWESWYINNIIADTNIYSNPFDTLLSVGVYSIDHYVYSNNGCVDSISNTIEVIDDPTAMFTLVDDTFCITAPTQYVSNDSIIGSGYILEYYWTIVNTNQDTIWSVILDTNLLPSFPILADSLNMKNIIFP